MHTRASYALLALTCVQWPSFMLAAFVYYKDPGACFVVFVAWEGLVDAICSIICGLALS